MKNVSRRWPAWIGAVFWAWAVLWSGPALAADELHLVPQDRVLVFAPHPDDETIGTGGVLQAAAAQGLPVKVVVMTNGDNNELSFLVYKKHPILTRAGIMRMGEIRRKETIKAMAEQGVPEQDLVFLGYPDFGTLNLLTRYWGNTKPYRNFSTRSDHVPYQSARTPLAPYVGESVVRDFKEVIRDFRPTKIFVSHPGDHNGDHQACYLFLRVALWEMGDEAGAPEIYPYLVHHRGWPSGPRGFHPHHALTPPRSFQADGIDWRAFPLTEAFIAAKRRAINKYQSQTRYNPPYLYTFVRQNELFGDFPMLPLRHTQSFLSDAQEASIKADPPAPTAGLVNYAYEDGHLNVRVRARRFLGRVLDVHLYLLGSRGDTDFARMPKLRIKVRGHLLVGAYDKLTPVSTEGIHVAREGRDILVQIPWKDLGEPQHLMSRAVYRLGAWSRGATPWRILEVD